jgi:hypothetical protein
MNEDSHATADVRRFSNPYGEPIRAFLADIRSLDWRFPFVAPAIQLLVLLFLAVLCGLLYCTIGVASHISSTFWGLIADSQRRMKTNGSAVEKSAYAVATGIFFLVFLPFFVVQFPFWLLGSLWARLGNVVAILLVLLMILLGAAFAVNRLFPGALPRLVKMIQS